MGKLKEKSLDNLLTKKFQLQKDIRHLLFEFEKEFQCKVSFIELTHERLDTLQSNDDFNSLLSNVVIKVII